MISIIITAYREEKTIGKAIEAVLSQKLKDFEIIVSAPDEETLEVARKYARKNKRIKILKDAGKGKPAALNMIVKKAKGDILVLTDGDVYVGKDSISKLISVLDDKKMGAVTGCPVSVNSRANRMGYWAYMLTAIADEIREKAGKNGDRIFCSGYLFAIRKSLFPHLPEELLSEDGYVSQKVYEKGFKIGYREDSKVYVKYPDNFSDWIKQKKRSAGGYNQIKKMTSVSLRSFSWESSGAFMFFKYPSNFLEWIWLFELFISRVYLWFAIYRDINIKKKSQKEIWQRVESTK